MEALSRLLIGTDSNLTRRNMIWNMIGSFVYAAASMILTMAVIQLVGDEKGGIFTFAFTALGQQMFTVSYFGIRPYQITDVDPRFTFGEYLKLRVITSSAAILIGMFYITVSGYTYEKALVVFFMVCYKVIDGFADVYEAEFQRSGRLHLTGKSNTFRTLLSVSVFLGILAVTRQLVPACAAAVAAQAAGVLLFDISIIRRLGNVDWSRTKGRSSLLMKSCSLLFLSVFLDFYIFSAAKYAIEANLSDASLAVYGAVFMPTSVISLVADFVIRPFLTELSLKWELREYADFASVIRKIAAVILALTVLAVGCAWFLGIPVLSILYYNIREALKECRWALVLIILGGGFKSILSLFYYVLVIMKKQRMIFAGYVIVGAAALVISPIFVKAAGIEGGALSYLILQILLAICFGASAAAVFLGEKKKNLRRNGDVYGL